MSSNFQFLDGAWHFFFLDELITEGTIDHAVRLAIKNGSDPLIAIQMATINNADCYRIENKGLLRRDISLIYVNVDNIHDLTIDKVIKNGKIIDTQQPSKG